MLRRMAKFSWRSIWRNKRRTIITCLAVGFGLAALLFSDGLMQGMAVYMVSGTTDPWMGDAQIHRDGYLDTRELELTVSDPDSIVAMMAGDTSVTAYTERVLSSASLSSAREMKPVMLTGVDRLTDPRITMLQTAIDTGSYFTGDSMEIIVGYRLARDLKVELGDILVVTAAQVDSGLASSMYRLSGICDFGNEQLDRYTAFINMGSSQHLLNLQGRIHEIAFKLEDPELVYDSTDVFWSRYSIMGNRAQGWPQLAPQISNMFQMVDMSMVMMTLILFGLVIFGIVNSLFMSVYERMFELGIMKAIGTRPGTIGFMVIMEGFWLGVLSIAIGLLLGLILLWITMKTGIRFGDMNFAGVTFDRPIYPVLLLSKLWKYPVITIMITTLAGVFPGIHAARQNPAESMRRSL